MSHCMIEEPRPNPSRFEPALHQSLARDPGLPKPEDVLHGDYLAFHTRQFGETHELASTV